VRRPEPGVFPESFTWGAATAAYQIEGAAAEDGRGPSVWDAFARKPGAVFDGHTGDVACDHYHRWREDVALMRHLGLGGYRCSVSWSRVLPEGKGRVNPKGLAFYDRLVDGLLEAGIDPWITLFHWDFPLALYDRGGWLSPDAPKWFADYAGVVVGKLGDRVRHWITLNEPQCFVGLGHQAGIHAPGLKLGVRDCLLACFHVQLAHGLGVRAIRAAARGRVLVGPAPISTHTAPATDAPRDVAAARRRTMSITGPDLFALTWWHDPIVKGRYPEDGLKVFGKDVPKHSRGDLETMSPPLDFFGLNFYRAGIVKAGRGDGIVDVPAPVGHPQTSFYWRIQPEAFYWGLRFYHERYGLPMAVTENGLANPDWVALDGRVHDPQRIDYTARHLLAFRRAIRDGVKALGYFHWSLLDNFEWGEGYRQRFGLIHVDFPSLRRTPKNSFDWYRNVIASRGASLGDTD
jgi:beta-glucosidase